MTGIEAVPVELGQRGAHQVHLLAERGQAGIGLRQWGCQAQVAGAQVVGAGESGGAADRPAYRRGVERQRVGDLVQQLERVAQFAVHLVDEGDDRDVAQAADLEQFARACLDALGGVDHHHRRIDRSQRAVGVLGKVLVAGGVEQVEDAVGVLEGHDRGDDGDAAFPLDAHPVGAGAAALALGADVAGELDGAAGAEEVFGQRGLAGVRVGDDREGAAAGDLGSLVGGEVVGHTGLDRKAPGRKGPTRRRTLYMEW